MSFFIRKFKKPKSYKVIQSIDDFISLHGINSFGQIELDSFTYFIDCDFLDTEGLELVAYGKKITIDAPSQNNNTLGIFGSGKRLISAYNTDLFIKNIGLSAIGANTEAIYMSGTGVESLDMFYTSFASGTCFGTLDGIRQGLMSTCFSFGAKQGFLLRGNIDGFRVTDTRILEINSYEVNNYIVKGDVGCRIRNFRSDVNADVASGDCAFSFDYDMITEDGGFQITNGRFQGDGVMVTPFTTGDSLKPEKSRKSIFLGNSGNIAKNTRVGATMVVTGESITAAPVGVDVEILGAVEVVDKEWFDITGNSIVAQSTKLGLCRVFGDIEIDAGANDIVEIIIKKWVNDTSSYVDVKRIPKQILNSIGGRDVQYYNIDTTTELNDGDFIKLFGNNNSDSTPFTMLNNSILSVKQI